jgi:DNA repair protein RadD
MQLYPDQQVVLDAVRQAYRDGFRAPLLVSPTGSGKTVMFSVVARGAAERRRRVHIHCHRQELIDQIDRALRAEGVVAGIIGADYPESPRAQVQIASVATLVKRLERTPPPDLIITDEGHHATLGNTWGKILTFWPKALRLGVTATPTRLSGEGLGDIYDTMVLGLTVQQLIDLGRLSPVSVYAPPPPDLSSVHTRMGDYIQSELAEVMGGSTVTGNAVDHYRKHAHQQPAIAFCASVDNAQKTAEQFRRGGYRAVTLDGKMDTQLRREVVADFTRGAIDVITTCDLISEGFDVPRVVVGIMLRPTQSLGLYLQQCGRVLRTFPGKERAIILDHAGNALRFGLPTQTREWTLQGAEHKKDSGGQVQAVGSVKVCKKCFSANDAYRTKCKECGTLFPVKARKLEQVDGELQELKEGAQVFKQERSSAKDLDALIQVGKMRGMKDPAGWAGHVLAAREKKKAQRTRDVNYG